MNNGLNKTRTYYRDQCISFRKVDERYGALSNMAGGYNLKINGVLVPSSEALYQSCRFPHLPDVQKTIISQQSPMTAKMVCKPYRRNSRQDWLHVRVAVMRWILRVKLAMHWSKFGGLLMDTGDLPIVEDSHKDDFWGALRVGEDRLIGENILGRLLMELREELRGPGKEALRIVEPPDIPDFLFLGKPIGQVGFGARRSEFIKPQTQQALDLGGATGISSEYHYDKDQKALHGGQSSKTPDGEDQMPEIETVIKASANKSPDTEQEQTGLRWMSKNKETERAELHKTIWRIANDLRGSVDGWDFKTYVLGMLFYRFISENLTGYLNVQERKAGKPDFDYAALSDEDAEFGRAETVKEKGFYILPSDLFVNVRAQARQDANLNETLTRVFKDIEGSALGSDSEDDFKGLFDDLDVNSGKLGPTVAKRNEKLVKLLDAIGDLPLNKGAGGFSHNTNDLFGDAYEYLMQMYASTAGKSGGEFYTPQEVSELLARITVVGKSEVNKVYDPACGSGSLLLKFAKVLGHDKVRQGFFGQEINLTTYNLCRINMFLHDINFEKFDIAHGDTLTDPAHWDDEPFEAIVSNPPYSIRWDGDANPLLINDPRFAPAGVLAPKSKADLAFTMHILSWLAVNGTAAIVEFPGVLYRSGAEQKIRQYLIDNNYVDAVIQLPPDLFFGTTIATCIIVLKKSKHDNATLFIDASAEFTRSGNKNKLTDAHQQKILDAFTGRKDIEHFARLVPNGEIAENGYNIAVLSYVEQLDTCVAVNIKVLNVEIARIVARQADLRTQIDAIVADLEGEAV